MAETNPIAQVQKTPDIFLERRVSYEAVFEGTNQSSVGLCTAGYIFVLARLDACVFPCVAVFGVAVCSHALGGNRSFYQSPRTFGKAIKSQRKGKDTAGSDRAVGTDLPRGLRFVCARLSIWLVERPDVADACGIGAVFAWIWHVRRGDARECLSFAHGGGAGKPNRDPNGALRDRAPSHVFGNAVDVFAYAADSRLPLGLASVFFLRCGRGASHPKRGEGFGGGIERLRSVHRTGEISPDPVCLVSNGIPYQTLASLTDWRTCEVGYR